MADDGGLFMENLEEFIHDEDRIVTYKWLSRTLSVSSNQAKRMLYAYLIKQRGDKNVNNISATYLVGGRCEMDEQMVHQYMLANDENLDDTKSHFDIVTSVHVYSLQKKNPKDSNAFYIVDYNIHQEHPNEFNRYSHIYCKDSIPLSDGGTRRGRSKQNISKENAVSSVGVLNGQGSSDSDKPKKSKKGQLPSMGMFAMDKHSLEDEKAKPAEADKPPQSDKTKQPTKMTGNKPKQAGGMMSFFGVPISESKKEQSKEDKPEEKKPEEKKTEEPKEKSPEKPKEKTPEKPSESINHTEDKPAPKNKTHKQNRRRIKNLDSSDEEEDPIPKKVTKLVSDSASEDEEEPIKKSNIKVKKTQKNQEESKTKKSNKKEKVNEENNQEENQNKPAKKNRKRKKESKPASSEEESPVRPSSSLTVVSETPTADQSKDRPTKMRKRRKVMRSKTYVDEDGFMVTEKVYESESTDATDDEDIAMKQETSQPPKKNSPDPKPKKVTELKPPKQAGIMSFFKKT